eukprot:4833379-Alexandrium_andersonii.AAC.1
MPAPPPPQGGRTRQPDEEPKPTSSTTLLEEGARTPCSGTKAEKEPTTAKEERARGRPDHRTRPFRKPKRKLRP